MMTLDQFAKEAVGVPFKDGGRDRSGWDCWGLLMCLYREVYGIDIPDLALLRFDVTRGPTQEMVDHDGWVKWLTVEIGRERPGDGILMRPWHVGVVLSPGVMIHAFSPDTDTCVCRYRHGAWRSRLEGIYRHDKLTS